jgi:hypothetical protein
MASDVLRLGWQWPAGRSADYKMLIKVSEISKESAGLFRKFESAAEHLPDAVVITGQATLGGEFAAGQAVAIRAPRAELKDVSVGRLAGVGVIRQDGKDKNICICVQGAPANLGADDLKKWLAQMECK